MTFNVVKNVKEKRSWKLGAFIGISLSKKLVPFGLVLS
jgi:hypothetical protein